MIQMAHMAQMVRCLPRLPLGSAVRAVSRRSRCPDSPDGTARMVLHGAAPRCSLALFRCRRIKQG